MLLVLLTNIRPGWEGLPRTNAPAYFCVREEERKFYDIDTWAKCFKTFYDRNLRVFLIKARVFVPGGLV
jgi:hypothetical protein